MRVMCVYVRDAMSCVCVLCVGVQVQCGFLVGGADVGAIHGEEQRDDV